MVTQAELVKSELTPEKLPRKVRLLFSVSLLLLLFGSCNADKAFINIEYALAYTQAITTPWGVVYFVENPLPDLIGHEQCHSQRLREIGALSYYADYLTGGACAEEVRCGAKATDHPVCSEFTAPMNVAQAR